jgi:hypothetical protein
VPENIEDHCPGLPPKQLFRQADGPDGRLPLAPVTDGAGDFDQGRRQFDPMLPANPAMLAEQLLGPDFQEINWRTWHLGSILVVFLPGDSFLARAGGNLGRRQEPADLSAIPGGIRSRIVLGIFLAGCR